MANEHRRQIVSAETAIDELRRLFDTMGGPYSRFYPAYQTARRAVDAGENTREDLETLRQAVQGASYYYLDRSVDIGTRHAERDLKIYDVPPRSLPYNFTAEARQDIDAALNAQIARSEALASLEMTEYVTGDETRQGTLSAWSIVGLVAFWATSMSVLAYHTTTDNMENRRKQAVAQIDKSTTPCCLAVHGQIVGENEMFHLTADPRYADHMSYSPFHRRCRTAVLVIPAEFVDDEVTADMRQAANEQAAQPRPSSRADKAHYKVVGYKVHRFERGHWRVYEEYRTNRDAREAATRLNERARQARRS